jgi:hypothetical protein
MSYIKSILKWVAQCFSGIGESIVDSRRRQVEAYLSKATSREDLDARMRAITGRGL